MHQAKRRELIPLLQGDSFQHSLFKALVYSLLILLPPLSVSTPPRIYSVSVLGRGKFIMMAAENHFLPSPCAPCSWNCKTWIFPPQAIIFVWYCSSLLTRLCPHSARKYFIDHLVKIFHTISLPTISLWDILFTIDSYISLLSSCPCSSDVLPVTSCRDGYYDIAGVCSLTLPIGKQLQHQVACSYFEQELHVKWSKQLN